MKTVSNQKLKDAVDLVTEQSFTVLELTYRWDRSKATINRMLHRYGVERHSLKGGREVVSAADVLWFEREHLADAQRLGRKPNKPGRAA